MATCSIPPKQAKCDSKMEPNWLELPIDITSNILQRLSTTEIVTIACHLCPLWWKICKDPLMWRTVHITNPRNATYNHEEKQKICHFAVKRSCGHLEDINIAYFATDDLLDSIAENANIRCLRLVRCLNISNKGFSEAVRKLPRLEELDISYSNLSNSLDVIGRSCPLLKSFKFAGGFEFQRHFSAEVSFVIAKTMKELRHLDIQGSKLSNDGLLSILDKCRLLESLNIRGCSNIDFTGSLRKRCIEQIRSVQSPRFNDEDYTSEDNDSDFDVLFVDSDEDGY
ncbi:putative F-box/LRR-repeat protein 23 [Vicia villosa]|uniref:putative F-box/LRR-repeat protein 23 n=1 Tax=Vicia villosa TaxID=3911 RepID=UPI00273C02D6|nr:putative F-box/LRR-repeat protein 23 [Vicia villosa]